MKQGKDFSGSTIENAQRRDIVKRLAVFTLLSVLLLSACSQPTPEIVKETVIVTQPPLPTHTPYPTYTPQEPLPTYTPQEPLPTYTVYPTYTPEPPKPTYTPYPTYTPVPKATNTRKPTNTPVPKATNTPVPTSTNTPAAAQEPIILTGSGSAVVDVDKDSMGVLVHITGNADGRHFAVANYGSGGEQYDLLVNTTDPYDGVRPMDFLDDEHTKRFEVTATGDWTIEITSLSPDVLGDHIINAPGSYVGTGDDVFFVLGDCDTATIEGNSEGRYFGVFGWYSKGRDLLVNTSDTYKGTVIMKRDTFAVEVVAVGAWSISITAP